MPKVAAALKALHPSGRAAVDDAGAERLLSLLIAPDAHNVPGYHEGEAQHPELVFLDIRMPGINGIEAARATDAVASGASTGNKRNEARFISNALSRANRAFHGS